MSLNIEVKGNPASLRAAGPWLTTAGQTIHGTGTQVHAARTESESTWTGQAGDSFRTAVSKAATTIDSLSTDFGSLASTLNTHAADLDAVRAQMNQAKQIAAAAGLTVTATVIHEPGPAPAAPPPLPTDKPATPQQQQAHAQATHAQAAYAAQVQAYQQAGRVVVSAQSFQARSQQLAAAALNKFLQWSSLSDLFSGAVGAAVDHSSKVRTQSFTLFRAAGQAGNLARNATNPAIAARFRAIQLQRIDAATTAQFKANSTALLRQANRLPRHVKGFLGLNFGQFVRGTGQIARFARPVLGKIPVLGVAITAASVGVTAATGGDWKREAIAGTASLAAGIIVGTAIGGPVGFVVGAAVGFGVGYIIDNHEQIGAAIGDAADTVTHAGKAVGNAAAAGVHAAADALGKFGKSLFG